jgi:hypothetical protein
MVWLGATTQVQCFTSTLARAESTLSTLTLAISVSMMNRNIKNIIITKSKQVSIIHVTYFTLRCCKGNRRPAFDFAAKNVSCTPDSMTIDTNNMLWIACWSGWQVKRHYVLLNCERVKNYYSAHLNTRKENLEQNCFFKNKLKIYTEGN